MEQAEVNELKEVITGIIKRNVTPEIFNWLEEKANGIQKEKGNAQLNLAFAAIPRKTGRQFIKITEDDKKIIEGVHKGFSIDDWTVDRLVRLWLLIQTDSSDKNGYCHKMETLFRGAEMNELATLYSSLFFSLILKNGKGGVQKVFAAI
ncbi:MAG: hypothetical protein WKG06_21505 [Segetibacter sp.]